MRGLAAIAVVLAIVHGGCGGRGSPADDGNSAPDVLGDAPDALPEVDQPAADMFELPDVPDIPATEKRHFSFRVICGVSMGANGITIAAHHPDQFDVVGAMGGYVDYRYMGHLFQYFLAGGFCPMEQILANLDHVNDPSDPKVFCGPVKPTQPWEWDDWDFNHWHYGDSGGHWGRDFFLEVLEGFMMAFGNFLFYNPDHPVLPPGVPQSWLDLPDSEKCAKPAVIGKPHNFNAEFNPKGEYDLVTFCDGDTPIDCKKLGIDPCDDSNPAYQKVRGDYDPTLPHDKPVTYMGAVDYNKNGKRDYGEPVVVNAWERFKDFGKDGCPDELEDGKGGCLDKPAAAPGPDPNGDNFDLLSNPGGTEGDFDYEKGEPFDDHGLDGVPEAISGFTDIGEGNGVWDMNPRGKELVDNDARAFLNTAPIEQIERIAWFWDGGIRDSIHALTSAYHQFNALKLRGVPVKEWDDWSDNPGAVLPGVACQDVLSHIGEIDYSAKSFGRNVMIRYGKPDATPAEIAAGDGKHVGLPCQIINRLLGFFTYGIKRLPDPILVADGDNAGTIIYGSHWSGALQNRRRFSLSLPPGYDLPENKDLRYPLVIFLPGHGMTSEAMIQSGVVMNLYMGLGTIPRFILLAPEGQCCYVHKKTKVRYCGCLKDGNPWECLDPQCKGPHESCKVEKIDNDDLTQECNGGHFFVNHKTNKWGDPKAGETMKFEDTLFEAIGFVDKTYRTRKAADIEVVIER